MCFDKSVSIKQNILFKKKKDYTIKKLNILPPKTFKNSPQLSTECEKNTVLKSKMPMYCVAEISIVLAWIPARHKQFCNAEGKQHQHTDVPTFQSMQIQLLCPLAAWLTDLTSSLQLAGNKQLLLIAACLE